MKNSIKELKTFLILWSTQSLSQLGSSMTGFALTLWLYQRTGSALQTALLSICSYAPYVVMSIFAGALSDRWDKKKTMLACDSFAACCTVLVLILLKTDLLQPFHMYLLNVVTGLMNTVQQPASDVAMTVITPEKYYQKTSGMRSFSNSAFRGEDSFGGKQGGSGPGAVSGDGEIWDFLSEGQPADSDFDSVSCGGELCGFRL